MTQPDPGELRARRRGALEILEAHGVYLMGASSSALQLGQLEAMAAVALDPAATAAPSAVGRVLKRALWLNLACWLVTVAALVLVAGYSHRSIAFGWEGAHCGNIHPYGSAAQYQCWERQIRQGPPQFWEVP